jgi:hypothetical protein
MAGRWHDHSRAPPHPRAHRTEGEPQCRLI